LLVVVLVVTTVAVLVLVDTEAALLVKAQVVEARLNQDFL
jgi:hypothetical protein